MSTFGRFVRLRAKEPSRSAPSTFQMTKSITAGCLIELDCMLPGWHERIPSSVKVVWICWNVISTGSTERSVSLKLIRSAHMQILGTCPKAYRPTKRRINSLWPMGKVLYSRHHMIGIQYRNAVALRDWLSCATIHSYLYSCFRGGKDEFQMFFPTCQVRVVRFYVSLLRFLLFLFFFLVLLPHPPLSPSSSCCPVPSVSRQSPCPVSAGNRDHLCSVFQAGPQPRPSALSVPCRTSTAPEIIFHMIESFRV